MKLEAKLQSAALKAIINFPKSKLWAKVNHEDNFCLAVGFLADKAMMDIISAFNKPAQWDWYNRVMKFDYNLRHRPYNKLVSNACQAAYKKLRKSLDK